MSLVVSVLGPFQASAAGRSLRFATDATRALLAYLAIQPEQPHPRALLAALLWPEQPQATAFTNLRQTLARLRKALPEPAAALLHITPQSVRLLHDGLSTDHGEFAHLLAACANHDHATLVGCAACAARMRAAVELYRGEFLAGLELSDSQAFDEWLLLRREALHRQVLDALQTVTRHAEAAADYSQMREFATRQIALEPWREQAHVQVMLALAATGQRSAALAHYETCCRILEQELGIEPELETQLLATRIRDGVLAPAALAVQLPPHQLPAQLTPFVGRERELAELAVQQPEVRLLTLVGAGGMGKTRLAIEAARTQLDRYPDGVFFLSLASLSHPLALAATIASALDIHTAGDPERALVQTLRDKRVLLVLDNVEQLLPDLGIVVTLLQAAPQLHILVTSREPLQLRGEQLYRVHPMEDSAGLALAEVETSSALRLFAQSARRAQSDFTLGAENLASVQRICGLVHGIPLGLELAAAWVGSLSLDEIAQEIAHSADFLTSEWRDAPERQRSMRAVFDWSWRLLDERERAVFRQLAVFRGGCTRAAAEAVVGISLRALTRLVQTSLLHRGAAGRYQIHELLRQFAAEQLAGVPDEQLAVSERHSRYYLNMVAQRERRMARTEPCQATAELQLELDNIRQAWVWASTHGGSDALARSAPGLRQFYSLAGLTA